MDYITFSRSFFSATGIPANLLLNGTPLYSSISEALELQPEQSWPSYPAERNPEFSSINPDLEYGHVHIEESGYDLYIGPIFTSPVSETLIREYFEETKTPPAYQEALSEFLYNIPVSGHPQFIRVLSFHHAFVKTDSHSGRCRHLCERPAAGADPRQCPGSSRPCCR
jgi:hypothetical protein